MSAGSHGNRLSENAVVVFGIVAIGFLAVTAIGVHVDWSEGQSIKTFAIAEIIGLLVALGVLVFVWVGTRRSRRYVDKLENSARLNEKLLAEIALRDIDQANAPFSAECAGADVDATGEAILGIDADGKCTYCNVAGARLLGYEKPANVVGQCRLSTLLADGEQGSSRCLESLRRGRRLLNEPVAFIRRDGSAFAAALSCRPINHNDAFAGAICRFQAREGDGVRADALVESEERFLAVAEASPIGLAITRLSDGFIFFANTALEALLQFPEGSLTGARSVDLYINAQEREEMVSEARTAGRVVSRETRLRRRDGSAVWVFLSFRLIIVGEESLIAAAIMDISERRRAEESLRKLSLAIEQSPVSVVITDALGNIEYVNPKFVEVSGYSPDEVIGQNPRILKSGSTSANDYRQLWRSITAGEAWRGELLNRNKAGETYWVSSSISPITAADGTITHFVSVGEDISDRKRYEERLLHRANYDQLTNLPSRVLVFERLRRALDRAKRGGATVTVAFIDLDDFKKINDTLGHAAGDKLLIEAANRLSQCVRTVDTVGRLGGDEFLVILSDLSSEREAERIIDRIITAFRQPFRIEDQLIHFTASIGLTVYPIDGDDPHVLLRNADAAMFRAKQSGRNHFKFFTADMNEKAQRRLFVESTLREAIDRHELYWTCPSFVERLSLCDGHFGLE